MSSFCVKNSHLFARQKKYTKITKNDPRVFLRAKIYTFLIRKVFKQKMNWKTGHIERPLRTMGEARRGMAGGGDFDPEFSDWSDEEDADGVSPDNQLYAGQPLLSGHTGGTSGKNCIKFGPDGKYLIGLELKMTTWANNVEANDGVMNFMRGAIEGQYQAKVMQTSTDVDECVYRLCLAVPEPQVLPLRNYVYDQGLLSLVNNAYQQMEHSPRGVFTGRSDVSSIVKVRNKIRNSPRLACLSGIAGVRPLPYSRLTFHYLRTDAELAPYDPERTIAAAVNIPPPLEFVGSETAGASSESTVSAIVGVGDLRRQRDAYHAKKGELDAAGRADLRSQMWSMLAEADAPPKVKL